MGIGDITATTTEHANMVALNTALDALSTGGATAGADITTFIITTNPRDGIFYLTKIVRAAA